MNTNKIETTIDLTNEELFKQNQIEEPELNELQKLQKLQKEKDEERNRLDKLYDEFKRVEYEAEMRKAFPPLDEQMAKLDPILQSELIEMEHLYQDQLKTAKEIQQNILDTTGNIHDAYIMCGEMSKQAVKTRNNKVKELRLIWGEFFYHNPV